MKAVQEFRNTQTSFDIFNKLKKVNSQTIGHYQIGKKLGKGGFARVYKATDLYTKLEVAVKVFDKKTMSDSNIANVEREIEIHKKLKHPYIAAIYQVIKTPSKIFIFMELCENGELFDYINDKGSLGQSLGGKIFYQIYEAVNYLHQNKIAHRDIKTENILLSKEMNAKLIDFGLANSYSESNRLKTFCGSPSYLAPEIIQRKTYNPKMIDVWCLGVLLYIMLEARLPFYDDSDELQKKNILQYNFMQMTNCSSKASELIKDILIPSSRRLQLQNIPNSSFAKQHFPKYSIFKPTVEFDRKIVETISIELLKSEDEILESLQKCLLDENYGLYHLYQIKMKKSNYEERKFLRKTIQLSTLEENPQKVGQYSTSKKEKEVVSQKKNDFRIRMTPPKVQKFKMRLREDSPDSPRRIIDCLRAYK